MTPTKPEKVTSVNSAYTKCLLLRFILSLASILSDRGMGCQQDFLLYLANSQKPYLQKNVVIIRHMQKCFQKFQTTNSNSTEKFIYSFGFTAKTTRNLFRPPNTSLKSVLNHHFCGRSLITALSIVCLAHSAVTRCSTKSGHQPWFLTHIDDDDDDESDGWCDGDSGIRHGPNTVVMQLECLPVYRFHPFFVVLPLWHPHFPERV